MASWTLGRPDLPIPWLTIAVVGFLVALLIGILLVQWRRRLRAERLLTERLDFETLLADVHAALVSLPSAAIESEIRRALSRVGESLGVDRGLVVEYVDSNEQMRSVFRPFRWMRPGAESAITEYRRDDFPWVMDRFLAGEVVRFTRPEELPPEAAIDRQAFRRDRVRSHVSIPFVLGGSVVGGLAFATVHHERAWSDDLVRRLRLLADVFSGVLARQRSHEALQRSRALSAAIVDSLPDKVIVVDQAGTIIAMNRRGGTHDRDDSSDGQGREAVGADYLALWRETVAAGSPGAAEILTGLTAVIGGDVGHFSREYQRTDAEGTRWFEFWVRRLRTEAGGAVVLRLDITARRRAEVEADQAHRALARTGRIATMGELTAAIAHEVNQPLTSIRLNAQAARRYLEAVPPDVDEVLAILGDIVEDDTRASDVIARVRGMVTLRPSELVEVDVNRLIRDVGRFLHGDAVLRNARVSHDLDASIRPIRADPVQLQQVLVNLVLNGFDAMLEVPPERRHVRISSRLTCDGACIAVRDAGCGFDETTRTRLFEAFYTTKPNGMGMGLRIARSIVESHGGRLWATRNDDEGVTFFISLPQANGALGGGAEARRDDVSAGREGGEPAARARRARGLPASSP